MTLYKCYLLYIILIPDLCVLFFNQAWLTQFHLPMSKQQDE